MAERCRQRERKSRAKNKARRAKHQGVPAGKVMMQELRETGIENWHPTSKRAMRKCVDIVKVSYTSKKLCWHQTAT